MPAIAPLVIKDGQATPANRTFGPVTTSGSKAEFAERSAATPAGFLGLTHEVRRPTTVGSAQRVIIGINLPVTETVAGTLQVTRFSSAKVEFNFANLSTEQERKDALAYVKNLLTDVNVANSVVNIEPFY